MNSYDLNSYDFSYMNSMFHELMYEFGCTKVPDVRVIKFVRVVYPNGSSLLLPASRASPPFLRILARANSFRGFVAPPRDE